MTTLQAANEAMAQLFVDTWTPTGYPFTLENESFNVPDAGPWARLTSRVTARTQETLGRAGNRRFQTLGSLFVQIFDDVDRGTRRSKQLAQTVIEGFEGVSLTGTTVRFYDVIPREIGPEGRWFQTNVEINFEFDETR